MATATAVLLGSVVLGFGAAAPALATSAPAVTVTSEGGIVADGPLNRVFVGDHTAGTVYAADQNGAKLGSLTGIPGVSGLAVSTDGSTLYAAAPTSHEIVAIDAATLTVQARYPINTNDGPTYEAFAGGKLSTQKRNPRLAVGRERHRRRRHHVGPLRCSRSGPGVYRWLRPAGRPTPSPSRSGGSWQGVRRPQHPLTSDGLAACCSVRQAAGTVSMTAKAPTMLTLTRRSPAAANSASNSLISRSLPPVMSSMFISIRGARPGSPILPTR